MYGSKVVEQEHAFKQSLRTYARPQSAYVKTGGFSSGMVKKASVTLLPSRAGDASRRKDILTDAQLTYSHKFINSQNKMKDY